MAGKSSLKDKLEDDELDLSMMQLTDIPVKDIELLGPKVVTINLSHNLLTCIPANFPLLGHITKLDMSKNGLVELPENFGGFKALKSLDLYANRLEKLPVSFAQLKSLKWLDLKDNPLCPALKQAAGDCITPNDCMLCAKKVVALLQSMESQLQRERQRRMEDEGRAQREVDRREEAERERVRQDKRMAKEKRREEARVREAEGKKETEVKAKHETQLNGNGAAAAQQNGSPHPRGPPAGQAEGRGLLASLVLFLLGLGVVGLGLAVSMIWVYTEGRLDAESVASALPAIRADLEEYLAAVGQGTARAWAGVTEKAGPYVESCVRSGRAAWAEGGKHLRKWARWLEREHGPTLARAGAMVQGAAGSVVEALRPAWEASRPFFHQLGKAIIEKSYEVAAFLQATFPAYIDWAAETGAAVAEVAISSWQKLVEAF